MTPAEMAAWAEARRIDSQADAAVRHAEEQQLERLRYQAGLADRQFNRVDPDNRLVAAGLERRWEAALAELRRAGADLARRAAVPENGAEPAAALDPKLRVQALALGRRLPAIWADSGVSREHRKALLRCLVDKVVLRRTGRDAAMVRIVWRGGAHSEKQVAQPVGTLAALPRGAEMEARVLALARAGVRDEEIIRTLTAEGHRSTRRDLHILPSTVQGIRLRNGVKAEWRCGRWPRVPGWLTVAEAASKLQVPEAWLRKALCTGRIRTRREASGRYLVPDRPDALDALQALRAGAATEADLRQGDNDEEGH